MLRTEPAEIIVEENVYKGIIDADGQKITSDILITSPEYVSSLLSVEKQR